MMEKKHKKHTKSILHLHHHVLHFMASPSSTTFFLLIILLAFSSSLALASTRFSPKDNILIDCGSESPTTLPDGRIFKSDSESLTYLNSSDEYKATDSKPHASSPVYSTCRIFKQEAKYSFHLTQPGFHWIRLHFFPVKTELFDLHKATFSVKTQKFVLLHSFNFNNSKNPILKEYLINSTESPLSLTFTPLKNSAAFINAIEVISAPDSLISDIGSSLFPVGEFSGLTNYAFQPIYRINNGGPLITPTNDTLGRTWVPDEKFLTNKNLAKKVSVTPNIIKFPENQPKMSPLIAPSTVYASATEMADAQVKQPNFNVTWRFEVENSFSYLVRLHFCDIVSEGLNQLYFNVYVNQKMAMASLDLSAMTGELTTPFYKDVVVNETEKGLLWIEVGPTAESEGGDVNAIVNGMEVMKMMMMSNGVDGLDGEFGGGGGRRRTVAAVGFAMMFGAFVGLGAMVVKWHRRPQDWQRRNSFSSWLLPLHAGDNSFTKSSMGSMSMGLGRYFSFSELQQATNNWNPNSIIGVGGFGNVYLGTIDHSTQVAIKRGNPQSQQGIHEFQTEIQILSKLRHRHLVSLIGYCDQNHEMILVYEFMSNGPFRDHLYGKKHLPPLSWKQRLQICIGSARGLHYLHTGTAQGIIHRDVKTTNILLDDDLTAKVSDFGLSKDAPIGRGHVSTAVKGSFGYLDPEYFRSQQLTEKSDVYSFGVVLLEALCARAALDPQLPREQVNLADWGMQWKRKGLIDKIMDPSLVGNVCPQSLNKFCDAADKCLADFGVDRPSMGDVLWNLEYALQLQEAYMQGKSGDDLTSEQSPSTPAVPIDDHSMFAQFDSNLSGR